MSKTVSEFIQYGKVEPSFGNGFKQFDGFTTEGDCGQPIFRRTGVTGQTVSQTPTQLSANKLNDSIGDEWELLAPQFLSYSGTQHFPSPYGDEGVGTYLYNDGSWSLVNSSFSLGKSTEAQAIAGTDDTTYMTPLKTAIAVSQVQKQTFAELEALSPTSTDPVRYICIDRANANYILQDSGYTALAGDLIFSNGRVAELQIDGNTSLVNFGDSSDWDLATDHLIERMQHEGKTIRFGDGTFLLSSSHTLDGSVPVSCSSDTVFSCSDFAGSLFIFDIQETRNGSTGWDGGEFIFNYTDSRSESAAIELTGLSTAFLQYCDFKPKLIRGSESGILNTHSPRTTTFGLENNVSWCNFSAKSQGGTFATKYVFNFTQGSGTGNNFVDSKLRVIGDGGVGLRFVGSGCVVGDLLISNCHSSSPTEDSASFIEVGDDTKYRRNVTMVNNQVDANVINPFKLSQVGTDAYREWRWIGNLGGGTDLSTATGVMEGSVIIDRNVSDVRVARKVSGLSSGTQLVHVCDVAVPQYESCKLEVNISSFIQGVGVNIHTSIWHVRNQTGSASPILKSREDTPSSVIVLSTTISSDVISLFVEVSPTASGSRVVAQIAATGSKFELIRINPND